jgi:hypothetical protein
MPSSTVPWSGRRICAVALAVAAALSASLVQAPAADAQRCVAPPGRAGIEQYCERLPGAGGDRPTGGQDGPTVGTDLDPQTRRALAETPAGTALLRLPEGSARGGARGDRAAGDGARSAEDPGEGVVGGLSAAASDATSATPIVVWILVAIAIALAATAWVRSRSSER